MRSLAILLAGTLAAFAAPALTRAQAVVPGGGSLLAWLGLAPGDRLTYTTMEGERICVEVGEAVELAGRRYAPLGGMAWPGLATDAQVFVPLDGTLGVGVIRGPMLRPAQALDWLLEPAAPRFLGRVAIAEPDAVPGDGWYAVGESPDEPFSLLYVHCRFCSDAGTYVWMERGRGITRIEERTIAGPRRLTLIGPGCPS